MKILYCSWNENSFHDTVCNLQKIVDEVIVVRREVKEYLDGRAVTEILEKIKDMDAVFSYDFFPLVSRLCRETGIKYISWIYDWPNYTVFNSEIYNDCNDVWLFERDGIRTLKQYRVSNLKYMPLAVDTGRLDGQLGSDIRNTQFLYDVSFVGNLYLKKEQAMMTEKVPDYYSGFVDALAAAQKKIFGYNLVNDVIDRDFTRKYLKEIHEELDVESVPEEFVLASQINKLVTGQERREILIEASQKYDVHLFSSSCKEDLGKVQLHGPVDYEKQVPEIFRKSKINLNITLRSITSAISLRVFDILGSGGFCLTNYQEGILEHFENGKDLVMYTGREDMLEKIQYYLEHEKERMDIACHGHESVKKYSYENAFNKMLGLSVMDEER